MSELGHVVFYVRELERSVQFYTEVVGLKEQGRIFGDWRRGQTYGAFYLRNLWSIQMLLKKWGIL